MNQQTPGINQQGNTLVPPSDGGSRGVASRQHRSQITSASHNAGDTNEVIEGSGSSHKALPSERRKKQQDEVLSNGFGIEKPATQIQLNFGLNPHTDINFGTIEERTKSQTDLRVALKESPKKQESFTGDGGIQADLPEEDIDNMQTFLRSSNHDIPKQDSNSLSQSPETGVGTSPMTKVRSRINQREKRWSQQQQLLQIPSSSESSPASPIFTKIELQNEGSSLPQSKFFHQDEVQMHRAAYEKVSKQYPPLPILPKNYLVHDDSPRSGGEFAYIKLLKFRGKDLGKSKFEIEKGVNQIDFPEGVTLKYIFAPPPESTDDRITAQGEIVYARCALDFSVKNHQAGTRKDEVLEENLLDVRRILKNSNNPNDQKKGGEQSDKNAMAKKGLINLQGVENFYKKRDPFDKTLIFESRFESGNLAAALKVNDQEYHLLLQNDVNTSGHTQWYFFRVQNTKRSNVVRFNILNLSKADSLYNEGMKVLVYSEKLSEEKDIGWHRSCHKISYYHNGIKKDHQKKTGYTKTLYTHTFTYEFQYDDDTVYFAYCYPYTYSDLIDDLSKISSDPSKANLFSRKTLCMSLAGNKVEMLTITSKNNLENLNKRKGVFLTARVHPGESVGSWMMKGAIEFLTDETNDEAEYLRQNFVFKVIPMLNPDGVINGNYRCSLAGCDLNRRWKAPSKVLHPCIYYTKQLLQQFAKERELVVFCDFHGHSRRKSIFMYGCHNPQAPEETRLFPYLMSKICPFFSFSYSRFGNQKSKEATARIAMFNEVKIPAIYTMESSFCGMDEGPYANYHFSTDNLMQTGRDFCRTLLLFSSIQVPQPICSSLLQQIQTLLDYAKQQNELRDLFNKDAEVEAMKQFTEKIRSIQLDKKEITTKRIKKALLQVLRSTHDVATEGESSSSVGSDKAPSEDNLEPEEMQMVVPNLEDEALGVKKPKKGGKKELLQVPGMPGAAVQETTTSISPVRRKTTAVQEGNLNSLKKVQTKVVVKGSRPQNSLKKEKNGESKTNLKGGEDNSEKKEDDEEVKMEEAIVLEPPDEAVTHKKKRKRNVESRDAWTQTDRSDYMLIKYRQRQKQALQNAKSQKFSKEEQLLYEQALQFHKAHQLQLLNKTQDVNALAQKQTSKGSMGDSQRVVSSVQGNQNVNKQQRYSDGTGLSGNSSMNVSRNLSSAQAPPTKQQQAVNHAQQVAGTAIVTDNGGQILGLAGKTHEITVQQNKDKKNLTGFSGKASHQAEQSMRMPSGASAQNAYMISSNQSAASGLPSISSQQQPNVAINKRKTLGGNNPQQAIYSPLKKNMGHEVPLNNAIIQIQQMAAAQVPQSDLSSSHSTQRIVNPKIIYPNTNMTIDNPVVAAAMMNQTNNMLFVAPHSKGNRSVPTRKHTQGQPSIHGGHAATLQDFNKGAYQQHQVSPQIDMTSATPVLENAYIQKRLMQQMQQQQFEQQLESATKMEYGSLRSNQYNMNNNQPTVVHNKTAIMKTQDQQWGVGGSGIGQVQQVLPPSDQQQQISTSAPVHRARKTVSSKNPNSHSMQSPPFHGVGGSSALPNGGSQHQMNFTGAPLISQNLFSSPQIANIGVPFKNSSTITTTQNTSSASGGFKISIVNVHNQFNIHNNIIINNNAQVINQQAPPMQVQSTQQAFFKGSSQPTKQGSFHQSPNPPQKPVDSQQNAPPAHQYIQMTSGPVIYGDGATSQQNQLSGGGIPKQQNSFNYNSPKRRK